MNVIATRPITITRTIAATCIVATAMLSTGCWIPVPDIEDTPFTAETKAVLGMSFSLDEQADPIEAAQKSIGEGDSQDPASAGDATTAPVEDATTVEAADTQDDATETASTAVPVTTGADETDETPESGSPGGGGGAAPAAPAPNQPPVAVATATPESVLDADGDGVEAITLDGSASGDSDGAVVAHRWVVLDQEVGTDAVLTVDFAVGTYTVTLEVTDDDGATGTDEITITVTEPMVEVVTAGAAFVVTAGGVTLTSTLDYETGETDTPLPVGELNWDERIGVPVLIEQTADATVVAGDGVTLTILDDGLVRIDADAAVGYTYTSLLAEPGWAKGADGYWMWAVPRGGSLHLLDAPGVAEQRSRDELHVDLPAGAMSGLAVFPSRTLDLSRLYGEGARPHVSFVFTYDNIDLFLTDPDQWFGLLEERGFGVFVLFEGLHERQHIPVRDENDRLVYRYSDPDRIEAFVEAAHARGFRVLSYAQCGLLVNQPVETTLAWMAEHQDAFDLNGWYFDNGHIDATWWGDYDFMRSVRDQIGDEGIIYHHDSVDVRSRYTGFSFVTLDSYCDYRLVGETGPIAAVADADDPYLLYYTRGFSGAFGDHKLSKQSTLSVADLHIRLAELQCTKRMGVPFVTPVANWDDYYRPTFEADRDAWQAEALAVVAAE